MIHNLSGLAIPNHIIRLLNRNLKYNFDSYINFDKLYDDFWQFKHRFCTQTNIPYDPNDDFNPSLHLPPRMRLGISNSKTVNDYLIDLERKVLNLRHEIPQFINSRDKRDLRFLRTWFEENNIIVKSTDKNLGVCILSVHDYHQKAIDLLKDNSVYQILRYPLNSDDIQNIIANLRVELMKIKPMISNQSWTFIEYGLNNHQTVPQFHILPKVHKTPWVGRPIVSSMKWVTRNMAVVINIELEKYSKLLPTTIIDSKQLIQHLDNQRVDSKCNFFSLDVVSMYTNIPVNETLLALKKFGINIGILHMIKLCIEYNYFNYGGNSYFQLDGIPMGINFAVAFANLAMFVLIESDKRLLKFKNQIKYWGRYLDDCNGIWKGDRASFEVFFKTINSINPKIKFTCGEFGRKCIFLDLEASINSENTISFKLFQKPLNKYLYIPFSSSHPTATKKGWIKGELIRFRRNNSTYEDFLKSSHWFYLRLRRRGYPDWFLHNIFLNFKYQDRDSELKLPQKYQDLKSLPENLKFSETIDFFFKLRKYIIQKAHQKHGFLKENDATTRKEFITFTTDFNKRLEKKRFASLLYPLPQWKMNNPYLDHSKVIVSWRIQNTLGRIFTHKMHNTKITRYIEEVNYQGS